MSPRIGRLNRIGVIVSFLVATSVAVPSGASDLTGWSLGGFHTGWSIRPDGGLTAVRRTAELHIETAALRAGTELIISWRAAKGVRVSLFWNRITIHHGRINSNRSELSVRLPETPTGRQTLGFDFSGAKRFQSVMGGSKRAKGRPAIGKDLAVIERIELPGTEKPTKEALIRCGANDPSGPFATPKPKNLIMFVVDSLRADHAGAGAEHVKTPNFDRIASNGVSYLRAFASSSWSKPTIATLLTGLFPGAHGCNGHDDKLATNIATVPEAFRQRGFATAVVAANGYIAAQHGFVRGFDFVRNPLREGRPYRALRLVDIAGAWLKKLPAGKPFFLYMQPVDPHVPYNPPRRFWTKFFPGRYLGPLVPAKTGDQLDLIKSRVLRLGPSDRAFLHALYDGAVEYTDFAFGALMKRLEELGVADDTAIVITADHGEEFWDHGSVGHAHSVYGEITRVPLIVGRWGRGAESASTRAPAIVSRETVSTVNLIGWLEGLFNLSLPTRVARNLPATGSIVLDRAASVVVGRCHYIVWRGGDEELFDLDADPKEQKNLIAAEPATTLAMRRAFANWFARSNSAASR